MLVGRQGERREIDRLLAAARLGTSGVLALTGEAGVGKSALLDAAVDGAAEMRVLRATGLEAEREIPFAMLLQLLRPALDAREGIPSAQAEALAAALALPHAGTPRLPDRFAIGAAVLSLLCRYAEDAPVVVVVDDLHLADAASLGALVFAARRLAADPVAVLAAVRSPEGDPAVAGLPTLALDGLPLDDARSLLAARGVVPGEDQLVRLHHATGGNPLALIELGGENRTVVESSETGLPLRVPRALAGAFGRRLALTDPACRAALLVAAVCGSDLRLVSDVCAALGHDAARLAEAERLGLVVLRGGTVEFRHPLVRAAAYSAAGPEERVAAHLATAAALPAADVDRRAWHLSEATWHPDAGVADLLAEAGAHAVDRGAYAAAASAYERSARVTPDAALRGERLLRAADHAWGAGDGALALMLLDERARTVGPQRVADVRDTEVRASIAARTGSLRRAADLLGAAADRAASPDDATVLLADAVHASFYLGDAREAAALADRLEALRPAVTEPRARALGLMATGMALVLAGTGGADHLREAVPLLESEPSLRADPRRLTWLLLAPLFLRDATSGARMRALVDEVRGSAGVGALPAVLFHVARDEATTTAWSSDGAVPAAQVRSWARAEADYAEAIRLAGETGQDTELAMSLAGLAWLESRMGRADACRRHGEVARRLCAAREIHVGEVWVASALGDLALSLGDASTAVAELQRLQDMLDDLGLDDVDLAPTPELVDALCRVGERDRAQDEAVRYHERALRKGQPWARARADRARGMVAGPDEYEGWFSAALDRHEQTLDEFEVARTRLAFGARLRREGRRVDARVHLRAALGSFDDLGAPRWRDHAATELAATGEHVRSASPDAAADLTPQELQVSLLLADGRTTREAAAALFLSPKTVEYHLRKVYVKLGIGSRSELADIVHRRA